MVEILDLSKVLWCYHLVNQNLNLIRHVLSHHRLLEVIDVVAIRDLWKVRWYFLVTQNRYLVVVANLREEFLSRRFEVEVIVAAEILDLLTVQWYCLVTQNRYHVVEALLRLFFG